MAPAAPGTPLPPLLTESTQVLVTHIPLPPLTSIAYAKFVPQSQQWQPHKTIELARQQVVNDVRQGARDVLGSLLPIVRISKEATALWIFAIDSGANTHEHQPGCEDVNQSPLTAVKRLQALTFDGLERYQLSHFTLSTLYPCSSQCAEMSAPCSSCTRTSSDSSIVGTHAPTSSSAATLLPRVPLRPIYKLFVDAVCDRLIDDICATSSGVIELRAPTGDPQALTSMHMPSATRLGNGFLSRGDGALPAWSNGWEHRSRQRPLVHTALDIHLSPTALHIHPLPTLTTLLPVPVSLPSSALSQTPNPPIIPGTPLILAPYPTPAFYVSTHAKTSISSSLLTQFGDALAGLGASSLSPPSRVFPSRSTSSSPNPKSSPPRVSSATLEKDAFILAFIPLTNTQGEPKGITALWPAHLAFVDTSPSRFHLTNLPEMPETEALLTPPRGSGAPTQPSLSASPSPRVRRRPASHGLSRRVNRTQRAFRALELSSYKRAPGVPIPGTAKHAAGYVESVAKEREKEREKANQERARREREIKEGKTSASGSSSTPTNPINGVPQATQSSGGSDVAGSSPSKGGAGAARLGLSTNSVFSNFFTKVAQGNDANTFYPSPPDWDPIASASGLGESQPLGRIPPGASTSPSADVHASSTEQPRARPDVSQTIGNTLNGMNLDMDMDMTNMGINLNDTMGMMGTIGLDPAEMMGGGFGSFTDNFTEDDFNFFDSTPPGVAMQDIQGSLHHLGTGDVAVDGWLTNGLAGVDQDTTTGLPPHGTTNVLQSGTPNSDDDHAPTSLPSQPMDGVQMSEDDADLLPPAPDLMPSSPAKSPWSPGNPPTPSLELNAQLPPGIGRTMFEPIPFGESHRLADGKYRDAKGKFAFCHMSPTLTPQSFIVPRSPGSPRNETEDGWKLRYDAATDPRIGVVNRLRGVKRKLPQNSASPKSAKDRARNQEWETLYDQDEDLDSPESSSSEEEDAEEAEPGEEFDDDFSLSSHPSRPSTPPPSGLPLKPTLLYCHFHHAHLLPLGMAIRPSYGDLVPDNDPPPVPISVPTPVSPAAALGSAAERSKTLELLAQSVAKEAVENNAWAEAWALSADAPPASPTVRMGWGVTQADLRQISELMSKVDGLKGPPPLSSLLEPSLLAGPAPDQPTPAVHGNKLQLMHPPWLSVGRAGLVHYMLPPAIRFWEKEGLCPRGGAKDVVAFVLFEEGHERSVLVEKWLERVSRAYTARGFGAHVPGKTEAFENGLVPLQFEAVRKTLPNLMSTLPPEPQHIVIYVIAPPSVYSSLKSHALRTIIMSQKRISKLAGQHDFDQDRVLVHFVPDYLVADPQTYPSTRYIGLERFVASVYDRLLRPTERQTSRQLWEYSPPFENRFQVPAYVLARKTPTQTYLEWDERPSLNVLDRHTFLQVGYRVSQCGKWLLAACIDERGEAHDVAVWSAPTQSDSATSTSNWIVSNIWIFAKQFVQRADTEWRIVVAKLGEMQESEVEVWMSHLETVGSAHPGPPVHVSLVCAQSDMPLLFLWPTDATKNTPPHTPTDPNSVFADVSSTTYSAFLPQRTPIISSTLLFPSHHPTMVSPPASEDDTDQPSSPKASIGILPLCTTALFDVPNDTDVSTVSTLYIHLLYAYKSAKSTLKKTTHEVHADITRNWHELAVLTRERWHFAQHRDLPFHLAALEVMSEVLDPSSLGPDAKEIEYLGG